jgi:hypothetical protein
MNQYSLILRVHVAGARPYRIGDEVFEQSLEEAIRFEASIIADNAGSDLLESPSKHREQLRDQRFPTSRPRSVV